MTDLPISKYDYWTLRFFRDTSAITAFVVAPIYQIFETRSLPVFLLASLVFLIIAHAATAFRHLPNSSTSIKTLLFNESIAVRWFVIGYATLVLWMVTSLIWSPAPKLGAIDAFVVAVAPILAAILAVEHSKTTLFRFSTILFTGFCLSSGLLALEVAEVTNFQVYGDLNGERHDLNRNAAQMILKPIIAGDVYAEADRIERINEVHGRHIFERRRN